MKQLPWDDGSIIHNARIIHMHLHVDVGIHVHIKQVSCPSGFPPFSNYKCIALICYPWTKKVTTLKAFTPTPQTRPNRPLG